MAIGLEDEFSEDTEALRNELMFRVTRFEINKNWIPL